MVREVPLEVELPETDVSNAFQVLFGNEEAVVAYHTKTNPGSEPEVTPWEQQHRTVRFTLDLSTSIPQFLKRVVGVSVVKVTETQTVAWEGREVVRIDSSPILDMVGGKQFTTAAAFTMERSSSGKHVQMRALVSCTAHGPWGMQSTIEGVMAEQAKQSLGVFLTFCQAYCRAANPTAQMPQTPGDAGLDVGDGEQFFDAADSMLVALSNGAPASASLKPSGDLADAASTAGLALQLGRVVGLLESMERRMSTLQQSVDRLQGAANGLGGWSSSSVACSFLAGSCLAAAGVLVVVQLHARRIGG